MKQSIFTCLLFLLPFTVSAQEYCMTAPVGFGRNATGGGNTSNIVQVNSVTGLKNALQATAPAIIIVTENIDFKGTMISVKVNNKTLLGLPGVKLIQSGNTGILGFSSGSKNFIIRNLIFEGPSAWDMDGSDLVQNTNCTDLWVDHCEFYDGMDDNFDNTRQADNITISWCKFGYDKPYRYLNMTGDGSGDHRLSNLIGGSGTDAPADGHYSITFMWNYWGDGCLDRMPRARNAELHILNCYYNVTTYNRSETDPGNNSQKGTTAISLTGGSRGTTCYIEGIHFKKVNNMARCSAESGNTASMKLVDCIPVSGRSLPANVGTTTVQPTYPYTALPASAVEEAVTSPCGAGATLMVDLFGNVSSACQDTVKPDIVDSGNCGAQGDNLKWTLTNDSVLTISGNGEMAAYVRAGSSPWYSYREQITKIDIQEGVTKIGIYVFTDCINLTEVNVSNSLTAIGLSVFQNCSRLTEINVDANNLHFSSVDGILYNRSQDTLICCPEGIQGSIIIPNSVTAIGGRAFSFCKGLTEITIPNSVTAMGGSVFQNCTNLKSITIPNSVSKMSSFTFRDCSALTEVNLGNSITSIEAFTFDNCSALKSITIPNSVTSIGNGVFQDCSALQSITIPNSVTSIGNGVFQDCSALQSITIPNSVTTIGELSFGNCNKLKDIYVYWSTTPPVISPFVFSGINLEYVKLHIPKDKFNIYGFMPVWKDFWIIDDATAVNEVTINELKFYPNPVKNELYIEYNGKRNFTLTDIAIYDASGRSVGTFFVTPLQSIDGTITVNVSHLPAGFYFLKFHTGNDLTAHKIVKE